MRRLLLATVLFCAGALSTGCGSGTETGSAPVANLSGGGSAPHFLSLVPSAPFERAYYARRRVWQKHDEATGPQTLEYTEKVWSDGQGQFSVVPEQVLAPAMSAQAQQVFLLMQKVREGFLYRLRDFRIHDLGSFLAGYTVEVLNGPVAVAGQHCERLRIRRATPSPTYWEIDVLASNGLILGSREFLQDGTKVGEVETLEYQENPDLTGITMHADLVTVPLVPATMVQQLGFAPLQPSFLPAGFALESAARVSLGAESWARFIYTDGAAELFLLHKREPAPAPDAAATDPAGTSAIKVFRVGRWTVAQSNANGNRLIVMGTQPVPVLIQVLQSTVH